MDPFAALKTMSNALEKVRSAEDKAALLDQIDVLRAALLDTREAVGDLQDKITDQREQIAGLKAELASRDSWDTQAARYSLTKMDSGVLVHALRPDAANGEPEHFLCPKCFYQKQKQVLQRQSYTEVWPDEDVYRAVYACPSCTGKYSFGALPIPGPKAEYEQAMRNRGPSTYY